MSSKKTIIPGMEEYNERPNFQTPQSNVSLKSNPVSRSMAPNKKPIVGFLYSVSKSLAGEFWPLKIGSNSIGRSPECDIVLSEGTVSEQHAELVVRQMRNPEKIIASVSDARSTCGTMINGESLGFEPRECFSGDIITIGSYYDLYFILIDAKEIGLNVCAEFIPTNANANVHQQNLSGNSPADFVFDPNSYDSDTDDSNTSGRTVVFGESDDIPPTTPNGGTIFM